MSSIKFLYDSAELAQAAYANLAQGETDLASNLDALRASTGAEMSQKQAEKFAARYTSNNRGQTLTIIRKFNYLFKSNAPPSSLSSSH